MKTQVTIYNNGQIKAQYGVIGFKAAVTSAMLHLTRELEINVQHLQKDCKIECVFLSKSEWVCTIFHNDEEVFGLTVQKA